MEKIEEEFYLAHEAKRDYLDSQRDDRSSILSIDLREKMNICDSQTERKQPTSMEIPQTNNEVTSPNLKAYKSPVLPLTLKETPIRCSPIFSEHERNTHEHGSLKSNEIPNYGRHLLSDTILGSQYGYANCENTISKHDVKSSEVHATAASFQPHHKAKHAASPLSNKEAPTIGQDLWRQLKRVEIPVFTGDKRTYSNWKAAFLACIDSAPATPEYKLLQLRQYLAEDALKSIENLGHSAVAYDAAKERLERKFGGKRRQVAIYLDELERFQQIRLGNARDLEQYADLLDVAMINLQEAGQCHELGTGSLYTKLQRKLPESMLARYHRWIFENGQTESVLSLRSWIIQESEFQTIASETVRGFNGDNEYTQTTRPVPRYRNQRALFGETGNNRGLSTSPCQVCDKQHKIWSCNDFILKSVPERWDIARKFQLCYRCLGDTHYGKTCTRSRQCGIDACRQLHHRLLHQEYRKSGATEVTMLSSSKIASKVVDTTELNHSAQGSSSLPLDSLTFHLEGKEQENETTLMAKDDYQPDFIALRTVPVMVKSGDKSIKVNALLDDGSTKTYINSDVAAELGLHGKTECVTVNVLNGQIKTFNTRPIEVLLESLCGNVRTNVTAFTADQVTGDMEAVNWNKYKRNWPHLKNIDFPYTTMRPRVDVLIGLDCADLHHAVEEVRGRPGEPIARLTPLGWTCIGTPGSNEQPKLQTRFSSTFFVHDQTELEKMNMNLKKFWEIEDTPSSKEQPIIRVEEKSALNKLATSLCYDDKMYRLGIPWREDKTKLPGNYKMALQRLENTEKKLQRSPYLATTYQQVIESYIEKGYVRKVPEHEQSNSKWFLPHFPVIRPDKDTTKIRIVFDASAKCHGASLNDAIHQGPKLQQDLFDILLRFRRFPVALVCDIAEMYLRIGISQEDQTFHRFLRRGSNHSHKPDVFEFDRVVFGVNSSPFQAQYVLRQHAKKFQGDYPMAAETILHSAYMDDSMDSIQNEENAIDLYQQLSQLLSAAGMYARKWLSNSSQVLEHVPLRDRKSEVDLDTDPLPCAKTLGVWWQATEDVFTFKENAPEDAMVYTKRNFLKKIATLFDPIGFLAPFTIRAKMLLQDMWTAGLEWDDELSETLVISACAWFKELSDLQQLQIPRCLQDKSKMLRSMSLQTFVDASESAYGSVVYSRRTYEDGSNSSNIIAAKTRVAPTTATSIPRLELMGAVIGVRLTSRIAKALNVQMNDCIFWSDSFNVLWWVRGRSCEFKPFIANRVGEIQTSTQPEQWRYIPTAQNPADCVTRGMSVANLIISDTWWRGPDFLRQGEEKWPASKSFEKPTGDVELKRCATTTLNMQTSPFMDRAYLTVTLGADNLNFPLDPSHLSSWLRLRRVLSWVHRFINNCQKFRTDREYGELLSSELKNAKLQLIRYAQQTEFPNELASLSRGRQLSSNSKIIALQPKIDDDGLIRSDGRLQNAKFLSYDVRYPVILPRNSRITKLIVKEFHEMGNHASGTNQTLAALSTRYWIISAREVIRQWEKECMECRRRKGKPCEQIMAPLPLSRLKTSLRAFSRTAVDFGGPYITVQGRGKSRQKRYLCLFTCLATRAVHLEIAFGLDTSSFLNTFYRMVNRRGLPEEMYSDNATNFKAADKELKALLLQLDEDKIKASASNKGIV